MHAEHLISLKIKCARVEFASFMAICRERASDVCRYAFYAVMSLRRRVHVYQEGIHTLTHAARACLNDSVSVSAAAARFVWNAFQ